MTKLTVPNSIEKPLHQTVTASQQAIESLKEPFEQMNVEKPPIPTIIISSPTEDNTARRFTI